MNSLRRWSYVALALAYLQIVFGAIVRISGSGLGCGDHWPTCDGQWFPSLVSTHLVIEITHRLIAASLFVAILVLVALAWRHRREPGVAGPRGVLRPASWAAVLWFAPAILGAITVWLELPPLIIVVHLLLAMTLLAVLAWTVIRARGLGGQAVLAGGVSPRTARGAIAAAGLAIIVVGMGAVTANVPAAAAACHGFPLCNGQWLPAGRPQHVQLVHRVLAFLLFFHMIGLTIGVARRRELPAVVRAVRTGMGVIVLQILVAAAMVSLYLPPVLQSLHEAMGALVWLSLFTMASLAAIGSRRPRLVSPEAVRGAEPPLVPRTPRSSVGVVARSVDS
ncbi:MAG TPA: COX15/CtaA family protein [Gemmatimonadaceae bacterium]|nr:COX15/CtaA family protein [Gemmatimonadaceae bacterium]